MSFAERVKGILKKYSPDIPEDLDKLIVLGEIFLNALKIIGTVIVILSGMELPAILL